MDTTLQAIVEVTLPSATCKNLSLDYATRRAYRCVSRQVDSKLRWVRTELLCRVISLLRCLSSNTFWRGYTILNNVRFDKNLGRCGERVISTELSRLTDWYS